MGAKLAVVQVSPGRLHPYDNNAKTHTEEQIKAVANSIKEFGFKNPVLAWTNEDGILEIIAGHARVKAAKMLGLDEVPVILCDDLSDAQRRALTLVDNQTTLMTGWDTDLLDYELDVLDGSVDMSALGFALDDADEIIADVVWGKLDEEFLVLPYSILDTKQGRWQERKKIWNGLIQDNGVHGSAELFPPNSLVWDHEGASILDPVMAELMCRWFAPGDGCNVFDCFAGGTAFGFVSSYLGHTFTGIELRKEQCEENLARCKAAGLSPRYICDDGRNVAKHLGPESQDLLVSCPPYYNMEVYSDDENDASNQKDFDSFYAILDSAFTAALKCLKKNRFAIVVCTDIRRKDGFYFDFVERLRATFEAGGAHLYNHLILATSLNNARFRARRNMRLRKTVRVHQDILVFFNGDPKAIKEEFGEVRTDGIADMG